MERGVNAAKRGPKSYERLNTLIQKMRSITNKLEKLYSIDKLTKITADQILDFFMRMRSGDIKTLSGKNYASVPDYINAFAAFWHWHRRVERKKGNEVPDITEDLDRSPQQSSKFVYFTEAEHQQLCQAAKYEYSVLMQFLFDSGIRSPGELINVRVSDLYPIKDTIH